MIRVLHYVGKMDRGGMETLIMNLYRNINRSQVQFDFAIHGDRNGDFEAEILNMGGRFYQFPHMRKNPIEYRKSWRKFWNENGNRYKVFHMHTNSLANIIAMEEAERADIKIRIIHSHSSFANKGRLQYLNNFLHKINQKKIINIATHLIACSDKAATWMFGGMQLGEKKVILLNNGVDIKKFSFSMKKREQIRKEIGVSDDTIVLGQIGSFLPVKNHEFTLSIMRELVKNNKKYLLVLVGDGELRSEIENRVKIFNIESKVRFLGKRSDVDALLSAFDIYIMPSLYEGLPVSLVEAQVNGVPALISDTITRSVYFNDNVKYLPINNGTMQWINEINSLESKHSTDIEKIIRSGFDITETCSNYVDILREYEEK